jgi:competence protein ComGC
MKKKKGVSLMTKIEKFKQIIAILEETKLNNDTMDIDALVEMCQKEVEMIEKKKNSSGLTATQKENENIKNQIMAYLIDNDLDRTTIADLQANGFDYSAQKLSALLNQLVKDEQMTKEINKDKKTVFVLV